MNNDIFNGSKLFLNIPIQVANDPRIKSDKSVLIFGEIYSMLNVTGAFFMGTEELARRRRCSEQTVYNCLNELEKLGYIKREKVTNDKGRTIGRKILLGDGLKSTLGMGSNTFEGVGKTHLTQIEQYNRSINNKDNNKENSNKSNSNNKYNFDYKKFFDFFKETTGKRYTATNNNKKLINARLNEGATKQDFYLITKHKAIQWKDNDMNKWLKPSTLFIPKHFEDYLNEAEAYFSAEPQKKKEESSAKEEKRKVDPIDEQIHRGKLFLEKFPDNEKVRKEIERLERNRDENRGDTAQ